MVRLVELRFGLLRRATRVGLLAVMTCACNNALDDPNPRFYRVDSGLCAPDQGGFTSQIDHPYLPLPSGSQWVLEGEQEQTPVRVTLTVKDETEKILGIENRVVEQERLEQGQLVTRTRLFFAQSREGALCLFGEDVDVYSGGEVVDHEGSWQAGRRDAQPGIWMPADPQPYMEFVKRNAPGVSEERSGIISIHDTVAVPEATFQDAMYLVDWDPLLGETFETGADRVVVEGVGLVVEGSLRLTEHQLDQSDSEED